MDASTSTLRGRRGTYGIGLAPVARLFLRCRRGRRGFLRGRRGTWGHVAALLRGRRGTLRHPLSFHVAGVVLGQIDFHFAWQAWHVWHRAGSGGALGSHAGVAVGAAAFCVAGVAHAQSLQKSLIKVATLIKVSGSFAFSLFFFDETLMKSCLLYLDLL